MPIPMPPSTVAAAPARIGRPHRPHRSRPPALALVVALAAGLLPSSARAERDVLSERAFLDELPVVLSASRLAQPVSEAPSATTVIDRDMIRASGARSVDELLRWVPGFQVGQRSGFLPLATYHGLSDESPRRMLVRIDGRSSYTPYYVSGTEWHKLTVDLDDIERIEVVRGSNAAAFGSQAFLGVVNIITRNPAQSPAARLHLAHGENGVRDRSASVSRRFGPGALRLSLGRDGDAGVDGLADSWRRHRADLRFDLQLDAAQRIEVHAGGTRLDGGAGRAHSVVNPEREMTSDGEFALLRWRWQPSSDEELSIAYAHEHNRLEDRYRIDALEEALVRDFGFDPARADAALTSFGLGPGAFVLVDYDAEAVREDLELEHTFAPHADLRLVWGLGARTDRIDSSAPLMASARERYRSQRLFGNLEWRASPRWIFNIGLMIEDGSYVGTLASPRLAANYRLAEGQVVRAAVSRTARRPTAFECRSDMRFHEANSGLLLERRYQTPARLGEETITAYELGYLAELPRWQSSIDLRVFEERAESLISYARRAAADDRFDGLALEAGNNADATVRGAEVSATWRPALTTWLTLNYALLDIDGTDPAFNASAPRHSGSLLAAWTPASHWQLSLAWHHVDEMGWYAAPDQRLDSYQRADLRVARSFSLGPGRGELALVMQSIGSRTEDFRRGLGNGPRGFLSLRLEL